MAQRSDFELLEAWGGGDRAAGDALFERYFDALYRFFRTKVMDDVSDLVQQTLLACVEGRDRFRRESTFRTYLYEVARHVLCAYYRQRRHGAKVDFNESGVADLCSSPSSVLGHRQDERMLLAVLQRLPLASQMVLELSFWEELSSQEIGEVLGISAAAARGRIARATEQLRTELARSREYIGVKVNRASGAASKHELSEPPLLRSALDALELRHCSEHP